MSNWVVNQSTQSNTEIIRDIIVVLVILALLLGI